MAQPARSIDMCSTHPFLRSCPNPQVVPFVSNAQRILVDMMGDPSRAELIRRAAGRQRRTASDLLFLVEEDDPTPMPAVKVLSPVFAPPESVASPDIVRLLPPASNASGEVVVGFAGVLLTWHSIIGDAVKGSQWNADVVIRSPLGAQYSLCVRNGLVSVAGEGAVFDPRFEAMRRELASGPSSLPLRASSCSVRSLRLINQLRT